MRSITGEEDGHSCRRARDSRPFLDARRLRGILPALLCAVALFMTSGAAASASPQDPGAAPLPPRAADGPVGLESIAAPGPSAPLSGPTSPAQPRAELPDAPAITYPLGKDTESAEDRSKPTWIVKFRTGSDRAAEVRSARAEGMAVRGELSHVFSGMVVRATEEQAAKLARRGNVEIVERSTAPIQDPAPSSSFGQAGALPSDPVAQDVQTAANLSQGLDRIDQRYRPLDQRYQYDVTAPNVIAYVIDNGFLVDHEEFTDRVWRPLTYVGNVMSDYCANNRTGHGTPAGSLVGGTWAGVAKKVVLSPIRTFGCDTGNDVAAANTVHALDYIIANHPAGWPAVINMSLGWEQTATLDAAVARATSAGFTVVVSSGNQRTDACTRSPGRVPSVITVGRTEANDAHYNDPTWGSNYGTCVDILAPGHHPGIPGASPESTTSYGWFNGTSAAAPLVSGAAALILSAYPSATPAQVEAQLVHDSTKNVITQIPAGTPNRLLFIPTRATTGIEVRATAPSSWDVCGTAGDRLFIPSVTGVDYFFNGTAIATGLYTAPVGTHTVTARARAGYSLVGAASWTVRITSGSPYTDVTTTTQFSNDICWMSQNYIATGFADGTFRPTTTVTRGQMSAFLYRLAGSPAFTPPARSPFKDLTPSSPFYTEISWLVSTKITGGYPDGTFRPGLTVTRGQMAAFLYRYAGSPTYNPPADSPFTDLTRTSQFYKPITWLADEKITGGYPNGTFRAWGGVTRGQMSAFMYRFASR